MEKLCQENIAYFDTDSVVFGARAGDPTLPLGPGLGDFASELKPDEILEEVIALGNTEGQEEGGQQMNVKENENSSRSWGNPDNEKEEEEEKPKASDNEADDEDGYIIEHLKPLRPQTLEEAWDEELAKEEREREDHQLLQEGVKTIKEIKDIVLQLQEELRTRVHGVEDRQTVEGGGPMWHVKRRPERRFSPLHLR
ncbi:unnamed protein product [Cyprideis torosa]|uniref:Uncharacterized protein n=1 Tax=Cyprideis torosa TaxID=163714 RepID=A0A7R8WGP9_9CRUS|nr:unnamed protein product [Cyprideis torosa]CAG0895571.1 unnamed protein product [Cyprideis torosa]